MFMLMAAPVLSADGSVIAIISSQQSKPYQQTMKSFQALLRQKHPQVKFIQSDSGVTDEIIPSTALLFALGSSAVRESLDEMADQPLLATMLINNKLLQKTSHATAVLLQTSVKKQLELHQRFLPRAKRIGILYNPLNNQQWVDTANTIAPKMGLEIVAIPVKSAKDLPSSLKLLGRKADSILAIADKTIYSSKTAKAVLLYSFRNRIPFVGLSKAWVKAGALYALDWDYSDLGRQCAVVAMRILDGEKAEMIPPQLPDKQIYLLNLKTAKHMKLDISQKLISGAEKVYQ